MTLESAFESLELWLLAATALGVQLTDRLWVAITCVKDQIAAVRDVDAKSMRHPARGLARRLVDRAKYLATEVAWSVTIARMAA